MRWRIVNKTPGFQPTVGTYSDWKGILAVEAQNQCVYCSIHENHMGGIRNFHVEHYRPKSKFDNLTNDYSNLFYACPICNVFKSNDWPNDPPNQDLDIIYYPDPSIDDYSLLFDVDFNLGLIKGKNTRAEYIVNKLYLNRPQLITNRRLLVLNDQLSRISPLVSKWFSLLEKSTHPLSKTALTELGKWSLDSMNLLLQLHKSIPYKVGDVKKI